MPKSLIDANLIIRFLLNDDPKKAIRIENLLQGNKENYLLVDVIIAEIIWVLSSYYKFDKVAIIDKIRALIHLDTISCNRILLDNSLNVWEKHNVSFIDAYIIAIAESKKLKIYSYDRGLDKVKITKRIEP